MSLIRIRIHESLIYILQIVLDLIVRRTDDRLEAKSADQRDTACHLLGIHLGKCLIQHNQTQCRRPVHLRRQVDLIKLCKACQKRHI